jgi:hypothetical protein
MGTLNGDYLMKQAMDGKLSKLTGLAGEQEMGRKIFKGGRCF